MTEAIQHILIHSSGRSGSNRLLGMLDVHDWTNCRNEPDEHVTSIRDFMQIQATLSQEKRDEAWAEALRIARVSRSKVDPFEQNKAYLRGPAWAVLSQLYRRQRLRRVLGMTSDEWRLSRLVLPDAKAASIVPVLKMKLSPISDWLVSYHRRNTQQTILHIVRHPIAYLKSLFARYISVVYRDDPETNYALTRVKLGDFPSMIGQEDLPESYSVFNDFKAQLLYWRQWNEPIYARFKESARYLLMTYEDVSKDLAAAAQNAFSVCGLTLSAAQAREVSVLKNVLFANPHSISFDTAMAQDAFDAVMQGSPLLPLWQDPTQLTQVPGAIRST